MFNVQFNVAKIISGGLGAICLTHVNDYNIHLYVFNSEWQRHIKSYKKSKIGTWDYILEKSRDAHSTPTIPVSPVNRGCVSVMVWLTIVWEPLRSIFALCDRKTAKEREAILKDPVRPLLQIMFPLNVPIFQNDYSSTQAAKQIQAWSQKILKLSLWIEQRRLIIKTLGCLCAHLESISERT